MIAKAHAGEMPGVEAAKAIARRMNQPGVQDRAGLARAGLALLRQAEPANGGAVQVRRVANRLASALKADYSDPERCMEAATVATQLRSFARGMSPMVDTLCLC